MKSGMKRMASTGVVGCISGTIWESNMGLGSASAEGELAQRDAAHRRENQFLCKGARKQ